MGPAESLGRVDGIIQRRDPGAGVVPMPAEFALMRPMIQALLMFTEMSVDAADEFTPTDNLPNEPLKTLHWH